MLQLAQFRNNDKKSRFEMLLGNAIAYAEYIRTEDRIIIFKTEIPASISKITDSSNFFINEIVDLCSAEKTELDVRCPFARAVLNKGPFQRT